MSTDLKLEVVILPVSDVDRAKEFYATTLGWRLDADFSTSEAFRVVQVTPPGSGTSVITRPGAGSCFTSARIRSLSQHGMAVADTPVRARRPGSRSGSATPGRLR